MMRRVAFTLAVIVLTTGVSMAEQKPGPNYRHLKFFDELVGTWVYEGPVKEDLSGIADKGTHVVNKLSWDWILNKNALEWNPCATFTDGSKYAEEFLIGWDAQREKIVYGGMDNTGGATLGTMNIDISNKSITFTGKGTNKDGEETSHTCVIKITGKNTITWQALDRKGYFVNGESPVYTLKRVKNPH